MTHAQVTALLAIAAVGRWSRSLMTALWRWHLRLGTSASWTSDGRASLARWRCSMRCWAPGNGAARWLIAAMVASGASRLGATCCAIACWAGPRTRATRSCGGAAAARRPARSSRSSRRRRCWRPALAAGAGRGVQSGAAPVGARDRALLLWASALAGESDRRSAAGAIQGAAGRRAAGRVATGLWRYSRHPNYFFEWLIWVAYALFALGVAVGSARAGAAPGADAVPAVPRHRHSGHRGPGHAQPRRRLSPLPGDDQRVRAVVPAEVVMIDHAARPRSPARRRCPGGHPADRRRPAARAGGRRRRGAGRRAGRAPDALRHAPIAVATDAANAQHYEVPRRVLRARARSAPEVQRAWWPPGVDDAGRGRSSGCSQLTDRARADRGRPTRFSSSGAAGDR